MMLALFGEVDLPDREVSAPVAAVRARAVTGPVPVLEPRMAVADRVALTVCSVLGVVCVAGFVIVADIIGGAS